MTPQTNSLYTEIETLLKSIPEFLTEEKELRYNKIKEMAEKYSDNFKFTKDRISSEDVRKNVTNQCENGANCYWTTWTDALNDSNFRIATKIERFDPTKFTDYADGSGPSYR